MTAQEFALAILSAAGVSGVLTAGVLWFGRTWLSERLKQSIQHEYDQKLAALNAQLRSETESSLTTLRASIEREAEKLRFATSSVGATQKAAIERKLAAIETLWGSVLAARENVPAVMGFIDILTVDEYKASKDHPQFKKLIGDVSPQKLEAMYKDNVGSKERIRPYVGEYLWALLSTYQSLILRTALLLQWGQNDTEKLNWHRDGGTQQLLKASLNDNEIAAFEKVTIGKIGWLQGTYERKILAAMQVVISGEHFAEEALAQALRMEEKVRTLKPRTTDA